MRMIAVTTADYSLITRRIKEQMNARSTAAASGDSAHTSTVYYEYVVRTTDTSTWKEEWAI